MSRSKKATNPEADAHAAAEGTLELVTEDQSANVDTMPRLDVPALIRPYRERLEAVRDTATTLTVTDAGQREEIELAFATKKALASIRLDLEKTRKEIVEPMKRFTAGVDAEARSLRTTIEALEERMVEQANFAQRKHAEEMERLQQEREELLRPFVENVETMVLNTSTEEMFRIMLDGAETSYYKKLDKERAEQKAQEERDRLAAEAQKEVERLKQEALDREAALEIERRATQKAFDDARRAETAKAHAETLAHNAELAKLKAASDKIKSDMQAKADAEAAEKEAERLAAKEAASAPDREKLLALAHYFRSTEFPKLTPANQATMEEIIGGVGRMAAYIEKRERGNCEPMQIRLQGALRGDRLLRAMSADNMADAAVRIVSSLNETIYDLRIENAALRAALQAVLDQVDFTSPHGPRMNEQIGAVLDLRVIANARQALTKGIS